MKKQEFLQGLKDGIPICLGYFSVSMAFGLTAVLSGLPVWSAVAISLFNVTSAGQFAGINILIADHQHQIFSHVTVGIPEGP